MRVECIRNINRQLISEENTIARKSLKVETESEIMATQDQALHSKCYDETRDYIVSAFPILVKEHYERRHDRLCAQLHFNV
jgi:hypothetical protein